MTIRLMRLPERPHPAATATIAPDMGRIWPPFMPRSSFNVHGRKVGRGACLRSTKAVSRFRNAGMPVRFGPQAPRLAGAMVASRFCTPAIAVQVGGKAPAHPGNSFLKARCRGLRGGSRGIRTTAVHQSSKLATWVRHPYSPPFLAFSSGTQTRGRVIFLEKPAGSSGITDEGQCHPASGAHGAVV